LFSNDSVAICIPPGRHVILSKVGFEGPTCGILPLKGKSKITTNGLKWNLNTDTVFGGLVSSSNSFDGVHQVARNGELYNRVEIDTTEHVIWTVEVDIG
jgi:thiamine pyrophosphokinase